MISAFGVEHGGYETVEKLANPFSALGTAAGGAARLGAKKLGQSANKIGPGIGPLTRGQSALKGSAIGAGKGLKKVGGFAMKRPGLTGGIGVGAAGAGAAGGGLMSQRRRY